MAGQNREEEDPCRLITHKYFNNMLCEQHNRKQNPKDEKRMKRCGRKKTEKSKYIMKNGGE